MRVSSLTRRMWAHAPSGHGSLFLSPPIGCAARSVNAPPSGYGRYLGCPYPQFPRRISKSFTPTIPSPFKSAMQSLPGTQGPQ